MKIKFTISIIIIIVFAITASTRAAPSGKVEGKVLDTVSGQPLFGANVMLKGTSFGAATNMDGFFNIINIPPGTYTIRVSYIGYTTKEESIQVREGRVLSLDFKLNPVAVEGQTVTVTAQASGQNAAINQQLASDKIVNVVSAARIQELPDANAAESVGRLPGISLVRSGGEAYGVVIRGLQPKYNKIMIDGVEMAATNTGDRGTDLSMISSNSLSGIEVYKTVTPDMDAAVLGGVVNFKLREAEKSTNNIPKLSFLAQGGYNNVVNTYNDYKFVLTAEDRYMNNRLGVFAQGIIERVNRTDGELGGSYDIISRNFGEPNPTELTSLTISYVPRERKRYDATLTLDYRMSEGKISFMNFLSRGNTTTKTYQQNYAWAGNTIYFKDKYQENVLNTVTNLINYDQTLFSSINMNVKLSHSFSENSMPKYFDMNFWQAAAGVGAIDNTLDPVEFARQAASKINLDLLDMYQIHTENSYSKQRDITASIDLDNAVSFSNNISVKFKAGGQFKYTYRWYSDLTAGGSLINPGGYPSRDAILRAYPWMMDSPYNLQLGSGKAFPIGVFIDPNFKYGNFFNGDYSMGPGTNIDIIEGALNAARDTSRNSGWQREFKPGNLDLIKNDYHGSEHRSAAYFMATFNIGSQVTIIPGVRYQGLETSYFAPRIYTADFAYSYPVTYPHQDTTIDQYHGYWLPDISFIYNPFSWLSTKLAYTSTLSYPDFDQITPLINVGATSITWHNFALKPARSQNYDVSLSIYDNTVGLLTVGGFLKKIDGMIFETGDRYPKDFSAFPGVPNNLSSLIQYSIDYSINNPFKTDVWGVSAEWQTHFWYFPYPLDGLVLNVNYTHIFSSAKYPFTYNYKTLEGRQVILHYIDTSYTDRLYQQPDDIANLSLGYDFKGFSILVSLIYQSNVFNSNNFWPELRVFKDKYIRWDISAKQDLPWNGLQVFMNIQNLNKENDTYLVQGPGFPSSAQDYGLTADLGLRLKF